jgi:single-strand DNA-binding protein
MNNISIVGRLTKDVEIQTTSNGTKFSRLNIAVQSEQKNSEGERLTDFFTCVVWREAAETIAKYFKKGNPIALAGSMNSRTYEKDGVKHTIWELNVKNFYFVGGGNSNNETSKAKTAKNTSNNDDDDDGLPF